MAEDIDKLSQVGQPHLLQVLPFLIGRGRTARQSTLVSLCWGDLRPSPAPTSFLRAGYASLPASLPSNWDVEETTRSCPRVPAAHLSFWHTNKLKAFSAPKKLSSSRISTALIQFGLKSRAIWKGTRGDPVSPDGSSCHPASSFHPAPPFRARIRAGFSAG